MSRTDRQEARGSSGYIPTKEGSSPAEVLEALRKAVVENPRLPEVPAKEVVRQLVLRVHQKQPVAAPVATMLDSMEAEEEDNPT